MGKLPNWRLYKECPQCKAWAFGQWDIYCSKCGHELGDHDEWLAGIRDYAKSILIVYLQKHPDLAQKADITKIPDEATENIRANESIMFHKGTTGRILLEWWHEVEAALNYWRETTVNDWWKIKGIYFPVDSIEQLHVFAITQHAKMVWREIIDDLNVDHLDWKTMTQAINRLTLP